MDLIKKEKRDHKIIRTIFLTLPLIISVTGVYLLYFFNNDIEKVLYDKNEMFGAALLIGILYFMTFFGLGIWVACWGIKSPKGYKYVIIEHNECENKYYTIHSVKMWGKLLWELKALVFVSYDEDNPKKFFTKETAVKHLDEKVEKERIEMEEAECKKRKTKSVVHIS